MVPDYFADRAKQWVQLAKRIGDPELARTFADRARLLTQTAMEAELSLGLAFKERVHVATALGKREQQLRWLASMVEASHDAIISKNTRGTITTWNKGAELLFGYTSAEVIGQPITILIPPDRLAEELSVLERINLGEHIENYETIRRRKGGSLVNVLLTISPVRNAEGKIVGAVKIARDITKRKRAEAREKILIAELDHRVKNVLARVDMVALSTRKGNSSIDEYARSLKGRIQSMAAAHALLSQQGWHGVGLGPCA